MKKIVNENIDEVMYIETLENNMTIKIIPKKNVEKFFVIWGVKFGSIDNNFIEMGTNKEIKLPDGVAHYLEHKMFEQEHGENSLYKLMGLGLDANAYTSFNHTAYLFSGREQFDEGLEELMDYVQNPYYTDENVNKERGIIEQEINMTKQRVKEKNYYNAMRCLYKNNPVTKDIAGSIESVNKITKEILYSCYNTFYHPSNTIMCIVGNVEPEEVLEKIKNNLIDKGEIPKIKRIYPEKEEKINKNMLKEKSNLSIPIFTIGYKDDSKFSNIEKDIAGQIILNSIIGKCSKCYQELYEKNLLIMEMDYFTEFSKIYFHTLMIGVSEDPEKVFEIVKDYIEEYKITEEDFERSKRKLIGEYISMYNDVEEIGQKIIMDSVEDIETFDYIKITKEMTLEKVEEIRKEMFKQENAILAINE